MTDEALHEVKESVRTHHREGDIVILSLHWGGNWGYEIPGSKRNFAHRLIDEAGVDLIHGHSSHHVKGLEVYHNKLIMYGCGDFINDYEGISGYETFRDDLSLMYFVKVKARSGQLLEVRMVPTQVKKFRVNRASKADARWLMNVLNRELYLDFRK